MKKFFLFFLGIYLCGYCQYDSDNINFHTSCDTISSRKFTKLVKRKLAEIRRTDTFTISNLLGIIKIGMSPALNSSHNKGKEKLFKEFQTIYWEKIISIASNNKEFEYAPLKGLVGYSKKFDMYITPPSKFSELPCHNFYFVKE
jgi:hypothetical protein